MNKIKSLQFLRACAFLAVLAAHCDFPLLEGSMGVSIFFVLSGFCMAINYIPRAESLPSSFKGCVRFGCGKIKKLYILHLLMIAYVVFFLWGMPDSFSDVVILIIHALLLQSLFPSSAVITPYNGVSWFLSTYMFVCMAAPFIIKCLAKLDEPRGRGMCDIYIYNKGSFSRSCYYARRRLYLALCLLRVFPGHSGIPRILLSALSHAGFHSWRSAW